MAAKCVFVESKLHDEPGNPAFDRVARWLNLLLNGTSAIA